MFCAQLETATGREIDSLNLTRKHRRKVRESERSDTSQYGYTIMARYEGDPSTLIDAMQRQIHAIDPSLAIFNIKTMEEHVHEALFLQRLVGTFFTVFAVTGLLLALIGL